MKIIWSSFEMGIVVIDDLDGISLETLVHTQLATGDYSGSYNTSIIQPENCFVIEVYPFASQDTYRKFVKSIIRIGLLTSGIFNHLTNASQDILRICCRVIKKNIY